MSDWTRVTFSWQGREIIARSGSYSTEWVAGLLVGWSCLNRAGGVLCLDQDCYRVESLSGLVEQYRLASRANPDDYLVLLPLPDHFLIWVREKGEYQVYQFSTLDFLSGFMEGAGMDGEDFRTYLRGWPRRRENDEIVTYAIEGYDLPPFPPARIVEGPPQPFTVEFPEESSEPFE